MGETALDITGLTFVSSEERDYYLLARIGIEVEKFLRSDAGRYLHQRAKIDYEAAKDQLVTVSLDDPKGPGEIRQLQQKAQVAHAFMRYCSEAIQEGLVSEKQLAEIQETQGD